MLLFALRTLLLQCCCCMTHLAKLHDTRRTISHMEVRSELHGRMQLQEVALFGPHSIQKPLDVRHAANPHGESPRLEGPLDIIDGDFTSTHSSACIGRNHSAGLDSSCSFVRTVHHFGSRLWQNGSTSA